MGGLIARLGVFGGTFDPPHIGHLILASEAIDQLNLSRVLWVLTPDPPHKKGQVITALPFRSRMLRAALAGNSKFEFSDVDINRQPPHYAVDTMKILRQENPAAELIYLMGSDSMHDLPNWHNPLEFVGACDALGVMCRPNNDIDLTEIEGVIPGVSAKVHFIRAPLLEISSCEIRERIALHRPYRYFLPDEVYNIIQKERLYL
jgi:nicotinate-nucleotide adenylyltransferase